MSTVAKNLIPNWIDRKIVVSLIFVVNDRWRKNVLKLTVGF